MRRTDPIAHFIDDVTAEHEAKRKEEVQHTRTACCLIFGMAWLVSIGVVVAIVRWLG